MCVCVCGGGGGGNNLPLPLFSIYKVLRLQTYPKSLFAEHLSVLPLKSANKIDSPGFWPNTKLWTEKKTGFVQSQSTPVTSGKTEDDF